MRWLCVVALLTVLGGCDYAAKTATELAVETATGQKVEIDTEGKKVTIHSKDGEEGSATITGEDGEVRIENKEGSAVFGSKKLPEDFPLPVIDGATVASSMSAKKPGGQNTHMVTLVTDAEPEAVATFYTAALRAKGFEETTNKVDVNGRAMVSITGTKDGTKALVTATRDPDKKQTLVMLHWEGP